MTDVAIPLVPPDERAARSALPSSDRNADLFHATAADAATAVHRSGGSLAFAVEDRSRAFAEELADGVLPDADIPTLRIDGDEPTEGEALRAIRAHSDAASVGLLVGDVGLVMRRHLDTAAMRLRREDVVVGPTPDGGWYYLGTRLDRSDLPDRLGGSLTGLLDGFGTADIDVGVLPLLPRIEDERQLDGVRELLAAMVDCGRAVSPYTAAWLESKPVTDTS